MITMRRAIGIDIGGTKIATGLVDDTGTVASETYDPLPLGGYSATVDHLAATVQQLRVTGENIEAIGVGVAAWLSADRRIVLEAANLGWRNRPFADDLATVCGLPVILSNDGDCAAWGEYVLAGRPPGAFVVLTIGTGVGGGIILGGSLLTGANGIAGELGHLTVHPGGRPCVCGGIGCLDPHGSGAAILADARDRVRANPGPAPYLWRLCEGNPDALTGDHVLAAAIAGEAVAIEAISLAAEAIAIASSQLSRVVDHAELVIGGGAGGLGELLLGPVRAAIAARPGVGPVRPRPRVRQASGGKWAGVIGAGTLALERSAPVSHEPP